MKHKMIEINIDRWVYRGYIIIEQLYPKPVRYSINKGGVSIEVGIISRTLCKNLIDRHIRANELKLINWHNDNYPPIDLNENHQHVRALIQEILRLRSLKC